MAGPEAKFYGKIADATRYSSIKIAVLDSGIAYQGMQSYRTHVEKKAAKNFVDEKKQDEALIDDYGHGTAVAYQIIRTSPRAKLYIGKVVEGIEVVKSAVAKAIRHAADPKEWGVDIINMSFGWEDVDEDVASAVQYAKSHGVLMFASTSNYGLTTGGRILYPAIADEVIAVDSAYGDGTPARSNPSSKLKQKDIRFTAPGVGIRTPWSNKIWDGASFASPTLAGMAALVLEFARQTPLVEAPSVARCLKLRYAMVAVLAEMSVQKGEDRFFFVCADILLTARGADGGNGQAPSSRYFVAWELVRLLRVNHHRQIGIEIFFE